MATRTKLGQWLGERLRVEHLSLRQAGARTGLSYTTIAAIINGVQPSAKTIQKMAGAFGGNGRLPLEDHLLTLAGYRGDRGAEEKPTYLKMIHLLTGEHQHIVEVLVRELARLEGIEGEK